MLKKLEYFSWKRAEDSPFYRSVGIQAVLAALTQRQVFLGVAPAVLDKQRKEADNNICSLNDLSKGLNVKHLRGEICSLAFFTLL